MCINPLSSSGVITYATNADTSTVVNNMVSVPTQASPESLRILLETDAPFMVPGNLYNDLPNIGKGKKLPICHSAMIPWTAKFVADITNKARGITPPAVDAVDGAEAPELSSNAWDADVVMRAARENARKVYGV